MEAPGDKSNDDFDADAKKICESLMGVLAGEDLKLSLSPCSREAGRPTRRRMPCPSPLCVAYRGCKRYSRASRRQTYQYGSADHV